MKRIMMMCRPQVKVDRIDIEAVYSSYASMGTEAFKEYCTGVIEGSSGKKETKMKFRSALMLIKSKDRMLKIVNDFYLAGRGLRV